jgi:hypothetical protein
MVGDHMGSPTVVFPRSRASHASPHHSDHQKHSQPPESITYCESTLSGVAVIVATQASTATEGSRI